MIEKEEFELLNKKYAPIIKSIIDRNSRFYGHRETIRWCFGYKDDASIVAECNKKSNVITINLKAVVEEDELTIEYFILHEIRHIFQHEVIEDFKKGISVPIDDEIVNKWIYESNNYIPAKDNEGNLNNKYFLQDSEMDAYLFSYSVMLYKYGQVDVYVPPFYGDEFYKLVEEWVEYFKNEKL